MAALVTAAVVAAGWIDALHGAQAPTPALGPTPDEVRTASPALPQGAVVRLGTRQWRHEGTVTYVAFLPGGKQLVTASQDNSIRLWDVATGKEMRRFKDQPPCPGPAPGKELPVRRRVAMARWGRPGLGSRSVCLSPDGTTVAATGPGNRVQLWEVASGRPLRQIEAPATGILGLVFSPDSKKLAGRTTNPGVVLWEAATGKLLTASKETDDKNRRVFFGGLGSYFLGFSPDGKVLVAPEAVVVAQQVKTAVVFWDAETGKEIRRLQTKQPFGATLAEYLPDGKLLAIAGGNVIELVDPATGQEVRQINAGQTGIAGLAFAPDGRTLAIRGVVQNTIELFAVETGKRLRTVGPAKEGGPKGPFFAGYGLSGRDIAFSPDSKHIASAAGYGVRIWEADTGKEIPTGVGHRADVTALAVSPDGKRIASRGADGTVRLWDAAAGRQGHVFNLPALTTCVALAPDGGTIALGQGDGKVLLWDVATGKELRRLAQHERGVAAVAFSADGKTLASRGSLDNRIRLHEVDSGKALRTISVEPSNNPFANGGAILASPYAAVGVRMGLAFSPDGRLLASPGVGVGNPAIPGGPPARAGSLNTLKLWDVATGKEVSQIELPGRDGVSGFVFAPNGRTLATQHRDQTVTLWEAASGKERARLGKVKAPAQALMTGYGMVALGGGTIGYVAMPGSPDSPSIAFAPDGRTLAFRMDAGTIGVWDVITGKEVGQLQGHTSRLTALAQSADGKILVSGGSDTTVVVWDAASVPRPAKPAPPQLADGKLDALWADLAGTDAARAYEVVLQLASAPGRAVPLLRSHLRPVEPVDAAKLAAWLGDLSSPRFRARQQAMQQLEKLGELAIPALNKVLTERPQLETRRRVEQLLDKATSRPFSAQQVRQVRALEVLELAGTAESRQLLASLTGGAPGALLTREAQAALARLAVPAPARP